ncbi:MAG: hypothetical protein QXW35_00700 [Candidatus Aenigmatarchaeota archaeon]
MEFNKRLILNWVEKQIKTGKNWEKLKLFNLYNYNTSGSFIIRNVKDQINELAYETTNYIFESDGTLLKEIVYFLILRGSNEFYIFDSEKVIKKVIKSIVHALWENEKFYFFSASLSPS